MHRSELLLGMKRVMRCLKVALKPVQAAKVGAYLMQFGTEVGKQPATSVTNSGKLKCYIVLIRPIRL